MSHETNDGLRNVEALRYDGETRRVREDRVIEETPIALLYNGFSFAVMMATPTDMEDFALGFALCEGVVESANEFRLVDIVHHAQGIALHAAIPQARFDALETRQRSLEGRSGCGLCGISSLDAALRPPRRVGDGPKIAATEIHSSLARLAHMQTLNRLSGGAHAAGFFTSDHFAADSLLVREDVGRHNAVDKLVGAMLAGGIAVSGRRLSRRHLARFVRNCAQSRECRDRGGRSDVGPDRPGDPPCRRCRDHTDCVRSRWTNERV